MKISYHVDEIPADRLRQTQDFLREIAAGPSRVLSWRSDRLLVQTDAVVAKVHAADIDADTLRLKMELLKGLENIFLPPFQAGFRQLDDGLCVSFWPLARSLQENAEELPWAEAGILLAKLHRIQLDPRLGPESRAITKVRRVLREAESLDRNDPDVKALFSAAACLDLSDTGFATLIHGDFHLGQLVFQGEGWRLIDVDDLGWGDPAWDLARPAAFFAAGLIPAEDWSLFLNAYRAAGGSALPSEGDPWPRLDAAAKALTVQCAATALLRARKTQSTLSDADQALLANCRRIAALPRN